MEVLKHRQKGLPGFFRTVLTSTGSLVDLSGAFQVRNLQKHCDFSGRSISDELADIWAQVGADIYHASAKFEQTHGRIP